MEDSTFLELVKQFFLSPGGASSSASLLSNFEEKREYPKNKTVRFLFLVEKFQNTEGELRKTKPGSGPKFEVRTIST